MPSSHRRQEDTATHASVSFAAVPADHSTPISCSHCAANAHLVQRLPAISGNGRGELRVFECVTCRKRSKMFIND